VRTQSTLGWAETDERAVDLVRILAMDAVQKAGSGHPGTAISPAPAAYLLLPCPEAGITEPWQLFVAGAGASIGVDHFGASAAYQRIYQEFGNNAERVAAAARDSLARVRA
jgi:transketolase